LIRRAVLVAAVITVCVQTPVNAGWEPVIGRDRMVWLATCETGNNTKHRTRSYVTAFGFYKRTFDLFADTPHQAAHKLTWNQQARVLERAFFYGWRKPDGSKQWPVGPYGHACWKKLWAKDATLRHLVCYHRKHQVRRWCRGETGEP